VSDRVALRKIYGQSLLTLGEMYPNIVVLDADISKSTSTCDFAKKFPERFFNFGVAEQNMLGVAAGLAASGKIPLVNTYSIFASLKACEQIRTSIAYPKLNVKIVATHGGLDVGKDGVTHQAIEDIAIMRAIPNMVVIAPADEVSVRRLLKAVIDYKGPVFLRYGRSPVPRVYKEDQDIEIGKALIIRDGSDVTFIAIGVMVNIALKAAKLMAKEGISARIVDMHTIKPLDEEILLKSAEETKAIVTAEDHTVNGGLGGAVAEWLGEHYPIPIERIGLKDTFGESGLSEDLFKHYHFTEKDFVEVAKRVIKRKQGR